MLPGEYIQSPSQLYFAILESSGDLVVYRGRLPTTYLNRKSGTAVQAASRQAKKYTQSFIRQRRISEIEIIDIMVNKLS